MNIDIYHLYRHIDFHCFAHPIVLDVLKVWAESIGWNARVSVCREKKVNLSSDAEVVGFSVYTQTAPAVYRLSDRLRKDGKIVILGGPHYRGPDTYREAFSHCDVLVNSICEQQWKDLLARIETGEIRHKSAEPLLINDKTNAFRYPPNHRSASTGRKRYQVPSVPTSLGCPYDCSFCSPYGKGTYLLRDIQTIRSDVEAIGASRVFLCDASFGINKGFTLELMKALAPLDKKLAVEITLSRLMDKDILAALATGGVRWIMAGIETLQLGMKKHGSVNTEEKLHRIIDRAHEYGMLVQGNIICGLDCDGPDSFDRLGHFFKTSRLDSIFMDILVPYPNTALFDRFRRQGRLIDTDWAHYDYRHVVYQPLRMSIEQLVKGFNNLYAEISRSRPLLKEAFRMCREKGLGAETAAMIVYDLYYKFDSGRKRRALSKNLERMPGTRPLPPQAEPLMDGTRRRT